MVELIDHLHRMVHGYFFERFSAPTKSANHSLPDSVIDIGSNRISSTDFHSKMRLRIIAYSRTELGSEFTLRTLICQNQR